MPPRRRQLFEDLGLMDETPQTNPYETLGLDGTFVDELLKEDAEGDAVRIVAGGMFRVLSRRYHTDVEETGNTERFQAIKDANTRIDGAPASQLKRWTKVERAASAIQLNKLREEANGRIDKVSELVQLNMELGNNPRHFSQLRWAQGVLLHHNKSTLLARADGRGLEITRGERFTDAQPGHSMTTFQRFMKGNKFFGLERGRRFAAYIDETGRTSLLESDLSYIMDISDPADRFKNRERSRGEKGTDLDILWTNTTEPLLLTTQVPSGLKDEEPAPNQMIVFRDAVRHISTRWHIPMDVSGSISDPNFFGRVRHRNTIGAAAITGSTSGSGSYFNVIPTAVQEMAEQGAGYSPLVDPGNSLVLFDPDNRTPVVTDARILGMIGNGPQYA